MRLAISKASLLERGCLDVLLVWQDGEKPILVDGHHRYRLCRELGIGFSTAIVTLRDRSAAIAFVISHQLARRNLTPEQQSHLRGKRYGSQKQRGGDRKSINTAKKAGPADEKSKGQLDPLVGDGRNSTAEMMAREYGVSPSTIKRDERLAEAIELIGAAEAGARAPLLDGSVKLTAKEAAAVPALEAQTLKAVACSIKRRDKAMVKRLLKSPPRQPGDDTDAIKAETAKRRRNGKEKVGARDRAAAIKGFGQFVRLLERSGFGEPCRVHLEAIIAIIKGDSS